MKQKAEHIHHHQTVLLQQLQALEMVEVCREFCYQLYLASLTYNPLSKASTITGKIGKTIGTHVEKIDETYSINKKNPKYKQTYNRYFHMDALGSITAVTDDHAKVVERRSYDAFGKIRSMDYGLTNNHAIIPANTVSQTSRAYTGHEQIKEIDGLIHMNARVYDSEIGRFLSADTMIPSPYASQSYNRYSYVRNNPMIFTDPTGHFLNGLKHFFHKLGREATRIYHQATNSKLGRSVLGFIEIVVGAYLTYTGNSIGPGLIKSGFDTINYDPSKPTSSTNQMGIHVTTTIPVGPGSNTEAEQVEALQHESDAIDRAHAGTHPTSASPVTNDKYRNGTGTSSYGGMGGDMVYNAGDKTFEYIPSSHTTQSMRQNQLDAMTRLVLQAEYIDGKTKGVIRNYRDNYYISYFDDPYLNRDGSFMKHDPLTATYGGGMRGPNSSYGRGVMITSLTYETNLKGGGYMYNDFVDVYFHEIDHDASLLGPRNGGRHEAAYYKYVESQRNNFYRSMYGDKYAQGSF